MNLAALAIHNSRVTLMAILIVIVTGITTYLNYPSTEDPTIEIRSASVTASYPGMTAVMVEELITIPLETAMREIAEIKEIKSTSSFGNTKISLEIHDYVQELQPVFQKIRNKASDVAAQLPEGTQGPVVRDEEGLTAIATIALWADGFDLTEMRPVAKEIRKALYSLAGIKRIDILGEQPEQIYLEVIPSQISSLQISPQQIFGALANQNIIAPGGEIIAGGRKLRLQPSGRFLDSTEIGKTLFTIPNTNRVLPLDEIVKVTRSVQSPAKFPSYFNNSPAIILSVATIEGTNNVAFGKALTHMLNDLQQDLPIGYVLDYATFQPDLIETAVSGAISNVYQTLVIVLTVVMLFLGIRTGLIVGSFVPMTMLVGILVMRFLDVELQRMSIAAMIIALGLLVDNGIVVAEDIRARLERGFSRFQAATDAVKTLSIPLFTSSLTTIFAFLPMLLTEGGAGDYVRSLAQVVAILLLASWFLSMTVTPTMCVWFMHVKQKEKPQNETGDDTNSAMLYQGRFYQSYAKILLWMLRHRLVVIGTLIALFIGSLQVMGLIRTEFFPLGERNQVLVYLDFEAGTDVQTTDSEVRKLTAWLSDKAENPDVKSNIAYIGYGGPRFFLALSPVDPDDHKGFILINTETTDDVAAVIKRVNHFIDQNLPGARGDAKRMWFGSTEPGIIQVRLIGPDGNILADRAEKIQDAMFDIADSVGVKQDWENKVLSLQVEIDQIRARRAGVTSQNIADSLQAFYAGRQVSIYREGDRQIPIIVRGTEEIRHSLSSLSQIQVFVPEKNNFISLDQVADLKASWQFSKIKRVDQQRTMTVEGRNLRLSAQEMLSRLQPVLDDLNMPAGSRWELAGELKDQAEANGKLFGLLPLAFAGIVILLIGQFNSFRKGGIIIGTIPLILIGGVLGLVVMQAAFGFMVMLGFFSLAGILINNGIVLIDRIETEEKQQEHMVEAIIFACLARLRPILMTTLTTVLGLVPLILFGGALFYGMASVIAFGLVVGTLFTLGFVPVVYSLLYRRSVKQPTIWDPR